MTVSTGTSARIWINKYINPSKFHPTVQKQDHPLRTKETLRGSKFNQYTSTCMKCINMLCSCDAIKLIEKDAIHQVRYIVHFNYKCHFSHTKWA